MATFCGSHHNAQGWAEWAANEWTEKHKTHVPAYRTNRWQTLTFHGSHGQPRLQLVDVGSTRFSRSSYRLFTTPTVCACTWRSGRCWMMDWWPKRWRRMHGRPGEQAGRTASWPDNKMHELHSIHVNIWMFMLLRALNENVDERRCSLW